MKKSLSFLLAIALVFGMFSAMASAATPSTPAEAGAVLKELGVLKGDDGDLLEGTVWKRQDIVVLLARLLAKEDAAAGTAKSHTFKDVPKGYYDGFLSWAKAEGYVNGYSATKFGFNDELTVKDFAAVVLRALGVKNDATIAEDAVKAGIFAEGTDFAAKAKRGDTFVALVASLNAEVAGTGKTLGEILGLPGFDSKPAVASAAAAGVKKVNVTFSKAVDTSKVAFVLKKGTDLVNVTKFSFDDAKKVATLETPVGLAAGDYTVTASGIELAAEKASASFSVVGEAIASVWVDDAAYRTSNTTATLAIKVLNQYGEEFANISNTDIVVTPADAGVTGTASSATNVNLAGLLQTTAALKVTVVETKTAKATTKDITVRNAKTLASITLSAPELPSGKTVLESASTYKVAVVAKDQYGNALDIDDAGDVTGFITFVKSDEITSVAYAEKNKLNVAISAFNGPKTLSVQAIVNATGNNSKIEFAVNGAVEIADVTLVAPTSKIGLGSPAKIELQAKDQYGNAMDADKIVAAFTANKLTVVGGNASIITVGAVSKDGDKAVVNITGAGKGTANLTVTVNSTGKSSTLAVTIVDAKYAQAVTLAPDFTKAVYGANIVLKATFVDQYGDKIEADGGANVVVEVDNADFGAGATPTVADLVGTGVTLQAAGHDKTTVVTVKLYKGAVAPANLVDTKSVSLKSAKSDEALTYVVEDLGTISDRADSDFASVYAKEVKVAGKDASGTKVALKSNAIIALSSSNSAVVVENDAKIAAVEGQEGDQFINVTITKQDGTPTVIAAPVKVSKAAPVAVSVTAKSGDDAYAKKTVTAGAGAEIANVFAKNSTLWFEVKDQFGTTALGDFSKTIVYVTNPSGSISTLASNAFDATAGAGTYKLTAIIGDKQVVVEIVVQ